MAGLCRILALVLRRRKAIFDAAMSAYKHILLVSYDECRLIDRRRLLEREGYQVSSALGFKEALANCSDGTARSIDLFILGHSIPIADKERLISAFRANATAPILSLWKHAEQIDCSVDYLAFSDSPDKLLGNVATILARSASADGD